MIDKSPTHSYMYLYKPTAGERQTNESTNPWSPTITICANYYVAIKTGL